MTAHEMAAPAKPVPLSPTAWQFPPVDAADEIGVVGIGADLEPSTIVHAYRHGLFPMPVTDPDARLEAIGWWSPLERGVLDFDELRISRSLRRSCRRYQVTVNTRFDEVIGACADSNRPGAWISPSIRAAYRELHRLGWTHSVEVLDGDQLVGGLYGVQIGGFFAGESMFHRATDASKVALVALVTGLEELGATWLDVQWQTEHLATLGVRSITQGEYLSRLEEALASPTDSLASRRDPNWVANSVRYLERIGYRPMDESPSYDP